MQGEKLPNPVQQTCKFILSYMLAIDTTAKHILNSFERPETKAETFEAERYFSSRRDVLKPFNLMVAAGAAFTPEELLYFYRVFAVFIKIGIRW